MANPRYRPRLSRGAQCHFRFRQARDIYSNLIRYVKLKLPSAMDDPWGNAWGEPSTSTTTHDAWDAKPVTTLTTSPPLGEEEADLGGASAGWTLDGAVRWDEGDAWGSSNSTWQPEDTFSNIKLATPLATPSEPEPERPDPDPASPTSEPDSAPEQEVDEPPAVTFDAPPEPDIDEEHLPTSAPRTPDPDADGFGTFNDGEAPVAVLAAPWSPVAPAFPEDTDGGWGTSAESAWGAADNAEKDTEEVKEEDEWTRAARAKAALDRALVRISCADDILYRRANYVIVAK